MPLALLASTVMLAGCAMGPHRSAQDTSQQPPPRAEDEQALALIADHEAALDALLAVSPVPTPAIAGQEPQADVCEAACAHVTAICELSQRICGLADRNDHVPELDARCEDATGRCGGARSRVAPRCECATH